jgi:hypothetical protein
MRSSADASGDLVHGKRGPETTVPEAALRDRSEILVRRH